MTILKFIQIVKIAETGMYLPLLRKQECFRP